MRLSAARSTLFFKLVLATIILDSTPIFLSNDSLSNAGHTATCYKNSKNDLDPNVRTQIDRLNTILRSYIQNDDFDHAGFAKSARLIEFSFNVISESIQETKCRRDKFLMQWRFQNDMLYSMLATSNLITLFDSNKMEYVLIKRALKLNIQLFGFYDIYGEANLQIEGYNYRIARFIEVLQIWEDVFDNLRGVAPNVNEIFEAILIECVHKIQYLRE